MTKKSGLQIGKRIIAFTIVLSLLAANGLSSLCMSKVEAKNDYWPNNVTLASEGEAAVVMDVDTGTVLYNVNGDVQHYPASITKIMTAMLGIEYCDLDEEVTFSHNACFNIDAGSSSIARDEGEIMTMEETLYGMMLESANECAIAIAEHVAQKLYGEDGTYEDFIELMNEKAKELGCKNTHFDNANGLPDSEHYTTAYDMALISAAAYKNEEFAKITGTKQYQIPPTNKHDEITPLNNHHMMLNFYQTSKYLYEYCVGGKTGYTTEANSTLVTYAKKDNMTLVCVIMNANSPDHYTDTRTLLDYCFDNFTVYNVGDYAELFNETVKKKAGSLADDINLIKVGDNGSVILPKTVDFSEAESTIVPDENDEDDVIGRIEYSYGDRYVGGADLIYTMSDSGSTYPFNNLSAEEGGSTKKVVHLDFKIILLLLLLVAVTFVIIKFIQAKSGKILAFKSRRIDNKKRKKSKYKKIGRRKKRRKRR